MSTPHLSATLFWDTDPATIDMDTHKRFIIVRTMERGSMDEVRAIWAYYGAAEIRAALLSARHLSPRTISFFASRFDLKRQEFRAYAADRSATAWAS
jgi:hypothetical protein